MDTPEIIPFESEDFGQLRTMPDGDDTWFVAADVSRALGYRDAEKMTRRLDDDEKGTRSVGTLGGNQNMTVITEAGLYAAVLGSKIESAKAFKRWVTHEVLPSIRRRGGYMASRPDESPDETMARAVLIASETISRQRAQLAEQSAAIRDMEPHALLGRTVAGEGSLYTATEAARFVAALNPGVKRCDVVGMLRRRRLMCQRGTAPTRLGIDRGLMRQVTSPPITHKDGTVTRDVYGKLTAKGLALLVSELAGMQPLPLAAGVAGE